MSEDSDKDHATIHAFGGMDPSKCKSKRDRWNEWVEGDREHAPMHAIGSRLSRVGNRIGETGHRVGEKLTARMQPRIESTQTAQRWNRYLEGDRDQAPLNRIAAWTHRKASSGYHRTVDSASWICSKVPPTRPPEEILFVPASRTRSDNIAQSSLRPTMTLLSHPGAVPSIVQPPEQRQMSHTQNSAVVQINSSLTGSAGYPIVASDRLITTTWPGTAQTSMSVVQTSVRARHSSYPVISLPPTSRAIASSSRKAQTFVSVPPPQTSQAVITKSLCVGQQQASAHMLGFTSVKLGAGSTAATQ